MEASRQVKQQGAAAGRATPLIALLAAFCLVPTSASGIETRQEKRQARVFTDGRLRPGHLESIRVNGFPGRGRTEVVLFPTAICGDECAAAARRGAVTNGRGAARFAVRMPGTFVDQRGKHVYFRDGERIDLEVLWNGPHESFDVAAANPEPIIVRAQGARHG